MKTTKREDNNNNGVITTIKNGLELIPLDLTIEILIRLPAKAIFKSICVSKTWCSIIRSKPFIKSYMSMSMSRLRLLFTFKLDHNDENQLLFFSAPHISKESKDSSSIVAKHEITISKTFPVDDYVIHNNNSFCGFICCSHHGQFMVCNPTTRQVINLPEDHGFDPDKMKCYMHLGYDSSNDQYKVLRMTTKPWSNLVCEHSVYTLGCQKSSYFPWRRIESRISNYIPSSFGVYINGVVYYEARIKPWISSIIVVSFDFATERLVQIKMPEEILNCLANYKGKLAGLSFLGNTSFSLWVLEDAKKQIWLKTETFVFSHSFWNLQLTFSGITDVGELIFTPKLFCDDFDVFYFDIKKKRTRSVKIEGVTNHDEFRCHRKHISSVSVSCNHVDSIIF